MASSLALVTASAFGEGVADVGFEAVDQGNGNTVANDGRTRVLINNGSGGNVTCTVTAVAGPSTFNEAFTKSLTVAAGDIGMMGPFPTAQFGNTIELSWDTGTSITVAVINETPTPRC